jgi:predicted dehydrogenase
MLKTGVELGAFDVEDLSTAFLRLQNGETLLLESSWAQWIAKDHCYVTVYGSDGGASIEWGARAIRIGTLSIWTEVRGCRRACIPAFRRTGCTRNAFWTSSRRFGQATTGTIAANRRSPVPS